MPWRRWELDRICGRDRGKEGAGSWHGYEQEREEAGEEEGQEPTI